ncbi:MAG: ABC transporter permease [Bacteriovoracaceae bacterium]
MKSSYLTLFKIILHGRASGNILIATILSFTFSITVILCTFGLMDGFDHLLKSGLRHSTGDIVITSKKGFYKPDDNFKDSLGDHFKNFTPIIQSEAFAIFNGKSTGIILRGVEPESFSKVTGLELNLKEGEIVVGEELLKHLSLKIGDNLAVTLGEGKDNSLPIIKMFRVGSAIKHGIYQKDLRFAYVPKDDLANTLKVNDRINVGLISLFNPQMPISDLEIVEHHINEIQDELDSSFILKPFWAEYSYLIEAVKVEKFSISLVLQLIVVVAVFNILAFVIYIMEKKSQEFFFLRAVGLSLKKIMNFWLITIVGIWAVSCTGAYFLADLFNLSLKHLPLFQVPGEIYVLSSLELNLTSASFITVFSIALIWILLASFIGYLRLKNRTIIQGLRQEFNS